jgi:hypothetical protein
MLVAFFIGAVLGLIGVSLYEVGKKSGYKEGYAHGVMDAYNDATELVKRFEFKR